MDRYLHMLSWGLLYAAFSVFVVSLYKALLVKDTVFYLSLGHQSKRPLFFTSDLVIYLILTIVSGIRLNTGSDFYNYYTYFNQITTRYHSFREVLLQSQSGYFGLSYLIKQVTDYPYAIFVVIAIISYAHLFHLIRKEVKDPLGALTTYLFLGYYAYSNNMLKQYIAMAFVMSAYLVFKKHHFLRALLYALLAVMFHYSAAIILMVMFLVHRLKPSFAKFYLAIVGGTLSALTLNILFIIFFRLIPSASGYEKYIDWRRSGQIRLIIAVLGMAVMHTILIYVILKYKETIKQESQERYSEIIFLIVGLAINIIAVRQWIINRIAVYFYQFILLILPTLFSSVPSDKRKKLKLLLYSIMFIYMIFISIFLGENEYFSYNTVFSGDEPISDIVYNYINGWTK